MGPVGSILRIPGYAVEGILPIAFCFRDAVPFIHLIQVEAEPLDAHGRIDLGRQADLFIDLLSLLRFLDGKRRADDLPAQHCRGIHDARAGLDVLARISHVLAGLDHQIRDIKADLLRMGRLVQGRDSGRVRRCHGGPAHGFVISFLLVSVDDLPPGHILPCDGRRDGAYDVRSGSRHVQGLSEVGEIGPVSFRVHRSHGKDPVIGSRVVILHVERIISCRRDDQTAFVLGVPDRLFLHLALTVGAQGQVDDGCSLIRRVMQPLDDVVGGSPPGVIQDFDRQDLRLYGSGDPVDPLSVFDRGCNDPRHMGPVAVIVLSVIRVLVSGGGLLNDGLSRQDLVL